MVGFLVALCFLSAYFAFNLSLFDSGKRIFTVILLFLIVFYDFIFIPIESYFTDTTYFIAKAWREYLVVFLSILLFFHIVITGKIYSKGFEIKLLIVIGIISIAGIISGIIHGYTFFSIVMSWRDYFLPILIAFLLYKVGIFKSLDITTLKITLLIFSVIIVVYGSYQYFYFDGDYTQLWSYEFIYRGKVEKFQQDPRFVQYTFIRDGNLRSSSVFVSPIEYGLFLVVPALFCFNKIISKSTFPIRVFYILFFVVLIIGIYTTQVRASFVALGIAIISCIAIRFIKKMNFALLIIFPLLLVGLTFFLIIYGFSAVEDTSALGRIVQYAKAPGLFEFAGMGLGVSVAESAFDSWYLSSMAVFGVFGLIYFYLTLSIFKYLYTLRIQSLSIRLPNDFVCLLYTVIGYFCAYIYIFAFHYSVASAQLLLLYILTFLMIAKLQVRLFEETNEA